MTSEKSPQVVVRTARQEDLPAIGQLWMEMTAFHQSMLSFTLKEDAASQQRTYMAQRLTAKGTIVVVADIGEQIVGYCRASIEHDPPIYDASPYGMIAELSVCPSWQRQGIGEKLYARVREWFTDQGITRLEVGMASKNLVSNSFWDKMGFQCIREVKRCDL